MVRRVEFPAIVWYRPGLVGAVGAGGWLECWGGVTERARILRKPDLYFKLYAGVKPIMRNR